MSTFCIEDPEVGDSVEIVARNSITPRVQQMLDIHGRHFVFNGWDDAQRLVLASSEYGRGVCFPKDEVLMVKAK